MKLLEYENFFTYERFSLIVGFTAAITITFFLATSYGRCIILFEPIWWIRIPEIIIGIFIAPYYFKKIFDFPKTNE